MDVKELWTVAKDLVGEEELTHRFRSWITGLIRKARAKGDGQRAEGEGLGAEIERILGDLNERTKSRFGATDSAKQLIMGLMKKGYIVEDFIRVHEVKCAQWKGNPKMEYCLRPSTLYRPSHFDEYLGEWYKMDREKREKAEKRRAAQEGFTQMSADIQKTQIDAELKNVKNAEREALVSELNGRKWDEFGSWLEFMRWTVRFPDGDALDEYEMPDRIREMRTMPGMLLAVAKGMIPESVEAEYARAKERSKNGEG